MTRRRWVLSAVGVAFFALLLGTTLVRPTSTTPPVETAASTVTLAHALPPSAAEATVSAGTLPPTTTTSVSPPTTTSPPPATSTPVATPVSRASYDGWVDPASMGAPWGDIVPGVLTFRGSPTRRWHGTGPVPTDPTVAWRFPAEGQMCSMSSVAGVEQEWCGMGWTGQPAVFERRGRTWVVFGAFDARVHFLDGATGEKIIPDFATADIIKGSVTVDPDGYPLVYVGSRDDRLRILAIDRARPTELWGLDADDTEPRMWNNDWDASPLVLDDHLFEGGENSRFHVVRLNRSYGDDGLVTVDPALVWDVAGWDDDLLAEVDSNVSIESSPLIVGNTLYFANSGGLVQGWDIAGLTDGVEPTRVFRFWAGDDVDATLVPDDDGMLYVGVEYERETIRSLELGQVLKLDPSRPDDPLVWAVEAHTKVGTGVWATPAIYGDLVVVSTADGEVLGISRDAGEVRWKLEIPGPVWSSPTIVDDVMVIGDCTGMVRAFDLSGTRSVPTQIWEAPTGICVEASAAVWDGTVYIGSRDGHLYALRDRP